MSRLREAIDLSPLARSLRCAGDAFQYGYGYGWSAYAADPRLYGWPGTMCATPFQPGADLSRGVVPSQVPIPRQRRPLEKIH
jgi:hypothetical protein